MQELSESNSHVELRMLTETTFSIEILGEKTPKKLIKRQSLFLWMVREGRRKMCGVKIWIASTFITACYFCYQNHNSSGYQARMTIHISVRQKSVDL